MTDYFVRFGRRHGEFDVEAGTTTLVPKTFVLKRIVSVFLEAATSTIEADALLQDLRQIEKFQDLALEQLRRNYLLWQRRWPERDSETGSGANADGQGGCRLAPCESRTRRHPRAPTSPARQQPWHANRPSTTTTSKANSFPRID